MIEQVLILGLAAFRMAFFFVVENGPFSIAERIRTFVGIKPGKVEGFLPELFSCIYCASVWAVGFAYLLWQIEPVLVIVIAAMALPVLFEKYYDK